MYVTNLDKKIDEPQEPRTIPTICAWSDLLGFSSPYTASNWEPDKEQYLKIAKRLRDVQILCMRTLHPWHEKCLTSNDAFIRNVNFENVRHIQEISMWFRSLIWFHMSVNSYEKDCGNPGIRTVISGGERLLHNFEDARFEDYVFNYTKKDPEGESSFPDSVKNEIVFFNPVSFQMNTAFSKSYILDEMGSKHGISGNAIYIEESVFRVIENNLSGWLPDTARFVKEEKEDTILVYVEHVENGWYHIGFEVSKPIVINTDKIKTNVYKLLLFYPWDEDPKEFSIDVNDDMSYNIDQHLQW